MVRAIGIWDCFTISPLYGIEYVVERIKRGLQLPWSWQMKSVADNGGNKPAAFVINASSFFSWHCSRTCTYQLLEFKKKMNK